MSLFEFDRCVCVRRGRPTRRCGSGVGAVSVWRHDLILCCTQLTEPDGIQSNREPFGAGRLRLIGEDVDLYHPHLDG